MSRGKMAALQVGLLLVAVFANAASKSETRIKVLDSQTSSVVLDDNGAPRNCDQVNFDAYCRSSTNTPMRSTLLVQEGDGPPFRITCAIESKYSKCRPLPIGQTFDARKEKHGITVYYVDDDGRPRKQLYTFVAADTKPSPADATAPAPAAQPAAASAPSTAPARIGKSVAQNPAPVAGAATSGLGDTVKCSFGSTPAGAEVTLDGRYVGSTPSVLGVTVGTHVVVISMPGFAQWKRELSVASGSELTVNAVLQKAQ